MIELKSLGSREQDVDTRLLFAFGSRVAHMVNGLDLNKRKLEILEGLRQIREAMMPGRAPYRLWFKWQKKQLDNGGRGETKLVALTCFMFERVDGEDRDVALKVYVSGCRKCEALVGFLATTDNLENATFFEVQPKHEISHEQVAGDEFVHSFLCKHCNMGAAAHFNVTNGPPTCANFTPMR